MLVTVVVHNFYKMIKTVQRDGACSNDYVVVYNHIE